EGRRLTDIAADYDVADMVFVHGMVPHRRSLEILLGSDIQVLVGFPPPKADLQVPGKLFEYMGVGRPVLALAPQESAIADVMSKSGITGEVCDPDDPEKIAQAIRRLASLRGKPAAKPNHTNTSSLLQFTRRDQVRRIAQLLHNRLQGSWADSSTVNSSGKE